MYGALAQSQPHTNTHTTHERVNSYSVQRAFKYPKFKLDMNTLVDKFHSKRKKIETQKLTHREREKREKKNLIWISHIFCHETDYFIFDCDECGCIKFYQWVFFFLSLSFTSFINCGWLSATGDGRIQCRKNVSIGPEAASMGHASRLFAALASYFYVIYCICRISLGCAVCPESITSLFVAHFTISNEIAVKCSDENATSISVVRELNSIQKKHILAGIYYFYGWLISWIWYSYTIV